MLNKILRFLTKNIYSQVVELIRGLDTYEKDLAKLIRKNLDPDVAAKAVIDCIQAKTILLINKIFRYNSNHVQ